MRTNKEKKVKKDSSMSVGLRASGRNPRALGTNPIAKRINPRAQALNPRALGTNPRALGTNPKALRQNKELFELIEASKGRGKIESKKG